MGRCILYLIVRKLRSVSLREARDIRCFGVRHCRPSWKARRGEVTNNYVMFDPERIKVVAKNGEVVRTVADDMPAPA